MVVASSEVVKEARRPSLSFFVGATPQHDDDDELYDDTEVTEDDFAEFDIDEDEEPVPKQVMFKYVFTVINEVIYSQLIHLNDNLKSMNISRIHQVRVKKTSKRQEVKPVNNQMIRNLEKKLPMLM